MVICEGSNVCSADTKVYGVECMVQNLKGNDTKQKEYDPSYLVS